MEAVAQRSACRRRASARARVEGRRVDAGCEARRSDGARHVALSAWRADGGAHAASRVHVRNEEEAVVSEEFPLSALLRAVVRYTDELADELRAAIVIGKLN